MEAVRRAGTELVPVDSEHSAAFQAIAGADPAASSASCSRPRAGRSAPGASSSWRTPRRSEALRHPNWSMGRKITIDSATLMNKGLELIEAYHLFPVEPTSSRWWCTPSRSFTPLSHIATARCWRSWRVPTCARRSRVSLAWPSRMAAPTKRLDLVEIGTAELRAARRAALPGARPGAPGHAAGRHGAGRAQCGQRGGGRGLPGGTAWGSFKSPNL